MTMFRVTGLSLTTSSGCPKQRSKYRLISDFAISDIRFYSLPFQLRVRTGTQSSSPSPLLSDINEPVSILVRIIMRRIIHVRWYYPSYMKYSYWPHDIFISVDPHALSVISVYLCRCVHHWPVWILNYMSKWRSQQCWYICGHNYQYPRNIHLYL